MTLFRELARRKLRTTLTIVGITIGIRVRDGRMVADERVAEGAQAA